MIHLSERKHAPFYDLFKLIVALILVIILIILLLRDRQGLPMQPLVTLTRSIETVASTSLSSPTAAPATATVLSPTGAASPVSSTSETQPTITSATATPLPSMTSTPEIQPTAASATTTSNPLPTSTPEAQPESTESVSTSDPNACLSALTRIQPGDKVRVVYRLNLRVHPGLGSPIILTNRVGTLMDVIGGPVCMPKSTTEGPRAYLWWNVRMEDDREGWSAEAPLILPYYFMETIR
jgi:hypothetical protein